MESAMSYLGLAITKEERDDAAFNWSTHVQTESSGRRRERSAHLPGLPTSKMFWGRVHRRRQVRQWRGVTDIGDPYAGRSNRFRDVPARTRRPPGRRV